MVKPWRCPHCRSKSGVPVQYGLPTREQSLAAARGELVLGGCVLTDDDPPRCCRTCRAALWSGEVFAVPGAGDLRRIVLHRVGRRRLEVAVDAELSVTVSWRDRAGPTERALRVPGVLADALILVLVLDAGLHGEALRRWLERRGIGFVGRLDGAIEQFAIVGDGMARFASDSDEILVHSSLERLVLQLVGATYRRNGFRSIVEFREWLASVGLDPVTSPDGS